MASLPPGGITDSRNWGKMVWRTAVTWDEKSGGAATGDRFRQSTVRFGIPGSPRTQGNSRFVDGDTPYPCRIEDNGVGNNRRRPSERQNGDCTTDSTCPCPPSGCLGREPIASRCGESGHRVPCGGPIHRPPKLLDLAAGAEVQYFNLGHTPFAIRNSQPSLGRRLDAPATDEAWQNVADIEWPGT
jgi:hypothetical protein